jgi:hypothetical protein
MMLEEYNRVDSLPSLAEIPTLSHLAILGAYLDELVKGTVVDDHANLMRNVYENVFMDVAKEVVLRPSGFAKAVEAYRPAHDCIESGNE